MEMDPYSRYHPTVCPVWTRQIPAHLQGLISQADFDALMTFTSTPVRIGTFLIRRGSAYLYLTHSTHGCTYLQIDWHPHCLVLLDWIELIIHCPELIIARRSPGHCAVLAPRFGTILGRA